MAKAKTMQSKVVTALQAGRELTASQIAKMGLANPHDAIYKMRAAGFPVYSNQRTVKGVTVTAYRLGTPRATRR
jgi:hypothetical protein